MTAVQTKGWYLKSWQVQCCKAVEETQTLNGNLDGVLSVAFLGTGCTGV